MKKMIQTCLLIFIVHAVSLSAECEPTIVQLAPPVLNPQTILKEQACTRPMREGSFKISSEKVGSKTITHIYGHGGSGWTTLFGSVNSGIKLFQAMPGVNKETPIRVIGSGCMGLTTAIELSRLGYKVVGITTKSLYDMPSWRAAGYFALVSVKTSPEEQENLNAIGVDTFKNYQLIDQGKHPYITQDAVRYLPVYCSEDTDSGVEDLEVRGLIPAHEHVTLDFGNGVLRPGFLKYMTYFMNTPNLMQQLTAQVRKLGIPIELGKVESFNDVKETVIFNCTGLGARELNQDDKMIAIRGHLIALNELSGTEHMDYMIYTKVYQDDKEAYIYMFPKAVIVSDDEKSYIPCRSVLGGTFIPNLDKLSSEELAKRDAEEYQKMLDRNALFFYGKPFPR
jgi:hypothetical protein